MHWGLFLTLWLTLAVPYPQNAECLACHGEKEMNDQAGHRFYQQLPY